MLNHRHAAFLVVNVPAQGAQLRKLATLGHLMHVVGQGHCILVSGGENHVTLHRELLRPLGAARHTVVVRHRTHSLIMMHHALRRRGFGVEPFHINAGEIALGDPEAPQASDFRSAEHDLVVATRSIVMPLPTRLLAEVLHNVGCSLRLELPRSSATITNLEEVPGARIHLQFRA